MFWIFELYLVFSFFISIFLVDIDIIDLIKQAWENKNLFGKIQLSLFIIIAYPCIIMSEIDKLFLLALLWIIRKGNKKKL